MTEEEVHRAVEMGIQGHEGKYCRVPQQCGQVNGQEKNKEEWLVVGKAQEHELCHMSLVVTCHGASWVGLWAETSTVRRRW